MDADDTLFDFRRCQRRALSEVLEEHGVQPTDGIVTAYDRINHSVWKALERGEIEKSVLVWKRFELLAEETGADFDPVAVSSEYERHLSRCAFLFPGAEETCRELAGKYDLYLITNGIGAVQKARIRDSGLDRYFKGVFISEEIGHEKPSREFFDAVADAVPGFDPSDTLVAGDSLTSDIRGGMECGADTCWINVRGAVVPADMEGRITYTLQSVTGLPGLLRGLELRAAGRYEAAEKALALNGIRFERCMALAPRTSFRIGGPADIAVFPGSAEALGKAVSILDKENVRRMIAGNASNLLFSDAGFRGAVVFTSDIRGVTVFGNTVTAGAGDSVASVCKAAREAGLTGLEFAYGIPGSVGGAVYMNAGAYGGQMSDVLESVQMTDLSTGEMREYGVSEMDFSYRHSAAADSAGRLAVTGARFRLSPGSRAEISAAMEGYAAKRRDRQPLEYPSAGSVFKRPAPDVYVGKLIEEAGLKGRSVGGAAVSQKHAGFIINTGGATASDVDALVEVIKKEISGRYGVTLECEIIRVPETEDE